MTLYVKTLMQTDSFEGKTGTRDWMETARSRIYITQRQKTRGEYCRVVPISVGKSSFEYRYRSWLTGSKADPLNTLHYGIANGSFTRYSPQRWPPPGVLLLVNEKVKIGSLLALFTLWTTGFLTSYYCEN